MGEGIRSYQKEIDESFREQGWSYWSLLSQMARLSEEVGEVARVLNHMYGDKPKKETEAKQHLEEELADVIYTVLCIANTNEIDMDIALNGVLEKIRERDNGRFTKKDEDEK
ncbi:nucleotide pyrophosphohydrolase [Alphaproteobacteria bacterium]|nr:nucleotide pyrophosphohydrolase [Alphaproteobacteria bacterium]